MSKEGTKHDHQKDQWDLLPTRPLIYVVRVLMFGAKKYGINNWMDLRDPHRRYYSAAMRHLVAYKTGEWYDLCLGHGKGWITQKPADRPEDCLHCSGQPHLACAICNLIFLLWFGDTSDDKERVYEEDKEGDEQQKRPGVL